MGRVRLKFSRWREMGSIDARVWRHYICMTSAKASLTGQVRARKSLNYMSQL